MYQVYILKSDKTNRYYIGYSSDLEKRLIFHNSGITPSTKFGKPWKLVYAESCQNKSDALKREKQIKSYKGGVAFKMLLKK